MTPNPYPLTIYYDGSCPLCNAEISNLKLRTQNGLLQFIDASATPNVSSLEGVSYANLMQIIHAQTAQGQVIQGVTVFRAAYEAVGLGWVTRPTTWPVIGQLADWLYPKLAANRNRIPRRLVSFLFEGVTRRAAEQAAQQARCNDKQCSASSQE